MNFVTRAYNKIELSQDGQSIIKTSNTQRLKDEINYYKMLSDYSLVGKWFPRLISAEISDLSKLEIEFFNYKNIYNVYQFDDHDSLRPVLEISNLLSFFQDVRWTTLNFAFCEKDQVVRWSDNLKKMYLDKTLTEYANLAKTREFKPICKRTRLNINGKDYANFNHIKSDVEKYINKFLTNPDYTIICFIHGDLCLGNLLSTYMEDDCSVSIKLIDPRGSFGEAGCLGDQRYDWAKIYHSIYGRYESIVNDYFTLNIDGESFSYEFTDQLDRLQKIYDKFFFTQCPYDINNIKFICGLIFIGMVARHYNDLNRQYVMYCTGIKMLNEVLYEK